MIVLNDINQMKKFATKMRFLVWFYDRTGTLTFFETTDDLQDLVRYINQMGVSNIQPWNSLCLNIDEVAEKMGNKIHFTNIYNFYAYLNKTYISSEIFCANDKRQFYLQFVYDNDLV